MSMRRILATVFAVVALSGCDEGTEEPLDFGGGSDGGEEMEPDPMEPEPEVREVAWQCITVAKGMAGISGFSHEAPPVSAMAVRDIENGCHETDDECIVDGLESMDDFEIRAYATEHYSYYGCDEPGTVCDVGQAEWVEAVVEHSILLAVIDRAGFWPAGWSEACDDL